MIRWAGLALAFAAASPAVAQEESVSGDWPHIPALAETTLADLQRLAEDLPNSGLTQLRIVQSALDSGDDATARAALWRYANMGGALSENGMNTVRRIFDEPGLALLGARMAFNAAPVVASRDAGEAPAGLGLVEGIVHVPFMDNLLVSSVTGRAIHGRTPAGWERFEEGDAMPGGSGLRAGSLMGMAYDPPRGWLWVASSVVDQTPDPDTAFSGMIGVGPGRDEVLWLAVDREAQPGDVALGPDGAAYLSAGGSGAVYVRRIGSVELEELIPPGRLRSPQGMAVTPDGSALIVADYSYGLARFDFETGALDRLTFEGGAMLDGIDGLIRDGDALIAIRNGVRPNAILRIEIDASGRSVTGVEPIERAHPDWGEPTLGTIHQAVLYYVAAARWDQFGEGGEADPESAPRPTRIRALPLGSE